MKAIEKKLKHFPPSDIIWDIEDLSKQPPWGTNISSDITDLSNYFVTSDGENLIDVLRRALAKGLETNKITSGYLHCRVDVPGTINRDSGKAIITGYSIEKK